MHHYIRSNVYIETCCPTAILCNFYEEIASFNLLLVHAVPFISHHYCRVTINITIKLISNVNNMNIMQNQALYFNERVPVRRCIEDLLQQILTQ